MRPQSKSNEWNELDEGIRDLILAEQVSFPVKVGNIAKNLGIQVRSATLSAGISGEIKEINGIVVARINRHDVKARQRFTVAHEIGHFLLHREFIGDGIIDDILYRSFLSNSQEAEANRLAADIIMPWHLIQENLESITTSHLERKIELLSESAEVSTTAMNIRLGRKKTGL